jgi:hypothetical protein
MPLRRCFAALSALFCLLLIACSPAPAPGGAAAAKPSGDVSAAASLAARSSPASAVTETTDGPPVYRVDASWPQPLPNKWILGQVAGIAVDKQDHIWIVHRPRSLTAHEAAAVQNPPTADCCVPAPAVLEFDQAGKLLQAWGGPMWSQEKKAWIEPAGDPWPANEHGVYVDADDNVWLAGNSETDHIVMKYSMAGMRLMTIGKLHETGGSNDTERLGRPADIAVDTAAHEVYVADGYLNRRVVVFDSLTGAYKRHWGAYGNKPDDSPQPAYDPKAEPAKTFTGPVHSVVLARDGLVYVADRTANRVQVFHHDGSFVKEKNIAPWTLDQGAAWDLALSPDERWLFVADGHNKKVWILNRDTLETAGSFGPGGRQAGEFEWVHNLATDSHGNVYTSEVNTGKRVQRFVPGGS